jgi:heterodisulfide reductase subunit A2
VVDVPKVLSTPPTLPYVEYGHGQPLRLLPGHPGQHGRIIREKGLNRIVMAACTPKTHEPLFQETLVNAGVEQIPLRNGQHPQPGLLGAQEQSPEIATQKAKDLVRMAVPRSR